MLVSSIIIVRKINLKDRAIANIHVVIQDKNKNGTEKYKFFLTSFPKDLNILSNQFKSQLDLEYNIRITIVTMNTIIKNAPNMAKFPTSINGCAICSGRDDPINNKMKPATTNPTIGQAIFNISSLILSSPSDADALNSVFYSIDNFIKAVLNRSSSKFILQNMHNHTILKTFILWEVSNKNKQQFYTPFCFMKLPSYFFFTFGKIKYPLSETGVPSSSIPSFHPSCSISFGGITIIYLYMALPLYTRAFCFCNFIKIGIITLVFNCGTTKYINSYYILDMAKYMSERNCRIKEMINARKARGMILLEEGFEPKEVNPHTWIVPSQNGCGTYTVTRLLSSRHWKCSCPDYLKRGVDCKHICAVKIWSGLKGRFQQLSLPEQQHIGLNGKIPIGSCKFCNSLDIVKYGKKNGKQNYMCKSCGRKFVDNIDFENMKYDPKIIALTLDLYFRGLSLRKVAGHLKQFHGLDVSYMSVHRWIEKYVSIMNEYVDTIQPDIGDVWHADEMMVNISGSWEYLWNVMDESTRFQLASVVSKERKVQDARMVFQKAKKNCGGRKPKYIVTDGLRSYKKAVNKEFPTNTHETEHLWNVGLQHHPNNNHVERLHGEIRCREKTMRALKKDDTSIIDGHRLYYNFIKEHQGLDGRTPAEEAGIIVDGDNKWLSLMRVAMYHKKKHAVQVVQS